MSESMFQKLFVRYPDAAKEFDRMTKEFQGKLDEQVKRTKGALEGPIGSMAALLGVAAMTWSGMIFKLRQQYAVSDEELGQIQEGIVQDFHTTLKQFDMLTDEELRNQLVEDRMMSLLEQRLADLTQMAQEKIQWTLEEKKQFGQEVKNIEQIFHERVEEADKKLRELS